MVQPSESKTATKRFKCQLGDYKVKPELKKETGTFFPSGNDPRDHDGYGKEF